jgi:two-component system response regulator (stage 0 sporulation protein A)
MEYGKINVAIVDDNVEFRNILSDYLSIQEHINIVGTGSDGIEALKLIEELNLDLVILDILMPHLDGLAVLERLATLNINPLPKIIVLSTAGQDEITQRAISLGADYYVVKPFDMSVLYQRILKVVSGSTSIGLTKKDLNIPEFTENTLTLKDHRDIELEAADIIREIGISSETKGYKFIREALILAINDLEMLSTTYAELYSTIAKKHNTTPGRVERAIQFAIEISLSKGQSIIINKLFRYAGRRDSDIPTNNEFIASLTHKLMLKNEIK